jgi:surfeit locus 1 family protein
LYDAFARGTAHEQVLVAGTPELPRYTQVIANGHYDGSRQILIDNMPSAAGRAGYEVITPFRLTGGGTLLVNRGWLALGASRRVLPIIDVAADERQIHGRTDHLPVAGIRLGIPVPLAAPFPIVAQYPTASAIASAIGGHDRVRAAEVVLLDARDRDGYERVWHPPGLPPERHIGYAVQWYALGATAVLLWVVLNLQRRDARI